MCGHRENDDVSTCFDKIKEISKRKKTGLSFCAKYPTYQKNHLFLDVYKRQEQAYEEGIDKKDFLDAYRKFKNVVGTKSEEKQLDKSFEEVSGYSIYKVFRFV